MTYIDPYHDVIRQVLQHPSYFKGVKIQGDTIIDIPQGSRKHVTYTTFQLIEFFSSEGEVPIDLARLCYFGLTEYTFTIPVKTCIIRSYKAHSIEEAIAQLQEDYFSSSDIEDVDPDLEEASLILEP